MATPYQNRPYGHAWFNLSSNTTIAMSDLSTNTSIETVNNASITKLFWSGGPWTIYRGANLVVTLANTEGHWNLSGVGTALSQDSTGTIVCNTASAAASLVIEVSKKAFANGTTGSP